MAVITAAAAAAGVVAQVADRVPMPAQGPAVLTMHSQVAAVSQVYSAAAGWLLQVPVVVVAVRVREHPEGEEVCSVPIQARVALLEVRVRMPAEQLQTDTVVASSDSLPTMAVAVAVQDP